MRFTLARRVRVFHVIASLFSGNNETPRSIADSYPRRVRVMTLTELNAEFSAVSRDVEAPSLAPAAPGVHII